MTFFDNLLSIVAPHECLRCHIEGGLLCDTCMATLPALAPQCYGCGVVKNQWQTCHSCRRQSPVYAVETAAIYGGVVKECIHHLKFERASAAAETMARMMHERFALPEAPTILTHIPTATSRVRQRGYDQAQLISRQLGMMGGWPVASLLTRQGQQRQVGSTKKERRRQLEAAFRVQRPQLVQGATILLIDDVITTGSSIEAAAKVLRTHGARRVMAYVFASARQ